MITFEDFQKLDLRVAEIKDAEKLGDNTLKVTVECDGPKTTVLEGDYNPQQLKGTNAVMIANPKPAKIHGIETQGILLTTTDDNGNPTLLQPDKNAKPGARIK